MQAGKDVYVEKPVSHNIQEGRRMVEAARRAIQAEQAKAIATIREEVVDLSLAGASAVLERNVGGDDDRKLVDQLVASGEGSRA